MFLSFKSIHYSKIFIWVYVFWFNFFSNSFHAFLFGKKEIFSWRIFQVTLMTCTSISHWWQRNPTSENLFKAAETSEIQRASKATPTPLQLSCSSYYLIFHGVLRSKPIVFIWVFSILAGLLVEVDENSRSLFGSGLLF